MPLRLGVRPDGFQFFPAGVELGDTGFFRFEFFGQLARLLAMLAMKIRVRKQPFDPRDVFLSFLDRRFHAFQLARFFPGEFARASWFRWSVAGSCGRFWGRRTGNAF